MLQFNRMAVRCLIRDVMRRPTSDKPFAKFVRRGDAYILNFGRHTRKFVSPPDSTPADLLTAEYEWNSFHPEDYYGRTIDMVRALQIACLFMRDWPFEDTLHCIVSYQDGSDLDESSRAFSMERFGTIDSFHMRFYVDRGERLLGNGDLEDITLNGIIEFDTNDLKKLGFAIGPKPRARRGRKPS